MWDLIVPVPDHCLSFYFKNKNMWIVIYILLNASHTTDMLINNKLCNYKMTKGSKNFFILSVFLAGFQNISFIIMSLCICSLK